MQTPNPTRIGTIIRHPSEFLPKYALIIEGRALEPAASHGEVLVFSTDVKPTIGDLVAVWAIPELVQPGIPQASLFRLALNVPPDISFPHKDHSESTVMPVLVLDALNPPARFSIRCSQVLAVHPCVDRQPAAAAVHASATAPRELEDA